MPHIAARTALLFALALPGCAHAGARQDGSAPRDLADVFAGVQGSVVEIRTSESRVISGGRTAIRASVGGIGSGVLVDDRGGILTAAHVVQVADRLEVEFADGTVRDAEVIASEPAADIALIRVVGPLPEGVTVAPIGDASTVRVGETVFVVGAPLGVSHTLTVGHLSARRRAGRFLHGQPVELLQTDAAINQGNSGGPMFDLDGEVIGIVSHIISKSGGSEGLGFAVSSNLAKALLIDRPSFWSGIEAVPLDAELGRALNVPPPSEGLLVLRVARGSLSDRIGLRGGSLPAKLGDEEILLGGDVILTVAGIPAARPDAPERIREAYLALAPGAEFRVEILRAGVRSTLKGQRRADPTGAPAVPGEPAPAGSRAPGER